MHMKYFSINNHIFIFEAGTMGWSLISQVTYFTSHVFSQKKSVKSVKSMTCEISDKYMTSSCHVFHKSCISQVMYFTSHEDAWERPKRKKISTFGDAGCSPLLQGERCVGSDSCHDNRKEASWLKCICFSVLQRSQFKKFVDARQKENRRLHFASGIASWFCVPITWAI